MAQLRLILGGVTPTSLRALVLARSAAPPQVRVEKVEGAVQMQFTLRQQPAVDDAFRQAMTQRGVSMYLLEADGLTQGTAYRIKAAMPGAATVHGDIRTLPLRLPAEGLTVAVGTCYYDGYHRDAELRTALALPRWGQTPAFHIWCGDNLYMDVPATSPANHPIGHTLERYLRYFLESDYASARALAATYTTYDDHEFWNNFPEFQIWLSRTWQESWQGYRDATITGKDLFQASLNAATVSGPGYFQVDLDPLSFFFLDTRSFRERGNATRLITDEARAALPGWCNRDRPGVLVLGQPLWIGKGGWTDLNLPHYERDYAFIWSCLRSAPYDTLVVSGDVHHSRMLKLNFSGAVNRNVYEFVTSPACCIPQIGNLEQDRGSLRDVPSAVENSGQSLSASYFFGTDAQNTFGLLRFVPFGNEVRVGASFIDYHPQDRFATAKPIEQLPRAAQNFAVCHDLNLFTLRMR